MNALSTMVLDKALIGELRALHPEVPTFVTLRQALFVELGMCGPTDLRQSIERLRMQGKIEWKQLKLTPSMVMASDAATAAEVKDPAAQRRGLNSSLSKAGHRPAPAPARPEPEVARAVREEANAVGERRRRANSCGGVAKPLAFEGVTLTEQLTSILAETPHDLMVAIARRHGAIWRRILQLGRTQGKRPSLTLYDVIEAGLRVLEQTFQQETVR